MRVLIADSQSRVRFALCTLLKRQDGMEVVGEAGTAAEVLDQAERTQPDVVLLHWRLQETTPDLVRRLQSLCPGLRVIALSARCETRHEALKAGAEAFIWKTEQPETLLAAITARGPARELEGGAGPDAVGTGVGGRRHAGPNLVSRGGSPVEGVQEEVNNGSLPAQQKACLVPPAAR